MKKLKDLCLEYDNTLKDALNCININGEGIVLVQRNRVFFGTLTDGDIRRAFLKGANGDDKLGLYCNANAIRLPVFSSDSVIQKCLNDNKINMIPLLNDEGIIVDFATKSRFHRFPVMEPSLYGREKEYVNDCLDTNWISSQGAYVERFESNLSEICDATSCVSSSSGTTALHLALEALGIGDGDEVIVPNLTFGASVNSILHAGATPVLVDVSETDWNICPQKILDVIGSNTKAIMPVHLYGNPCQMDTIMNIASEHNLLVIEDCAEALGAKISGQPVGSFGDAASFSFFANKVVTCGEGGAVIFKESLIGEKAKILRDHGMSPNKKYWHETVGYNYRMTNIQAAIGCAQLELLEDFTAKREKIWSKYENELLPSGYFRQQELRIGSVRCNWLFTLSLIPKLSQYRDQLIDELRLVGIETRPMFYPMSEMPAFETNTKKASNLNASVNLSMGGISFPSSLSLKNEEITLISKKTLNIIKKLLIQDKV